MEDIIVLFTTEEIKAQRINCPYSIVQSRPQGRGQGCSGDTVHKKLHTQLFCLEGAAELKWTPDIFKSSKLSVEDSKPRERHLFGLTWVLDDCKVLRKYSYHQTYKKG